MLLVAYFELYPKKTLRLFAKLDLAIQIFPRIRQQMKHWADIEWRFLHKIIQSTTHEQSIQSVLLLT